MGFERLGLSEGILSAVKDSGYETPTDIQAKAIPHVLMGRDILGLAQTGTGKTASFTLPMIDILSEGRARARMPRSLILEPTRELADQVAENFDKYGKNHKLSKALLIGGVNFAEQKAALDKGVDVLIATPGRLLDHMERGNLLLTGIDILVVDEADRMLDMGFIPDVEKICAAIPKSHQTLFFSATMAPSIERLTKKFLNDPRMVEAAKPSSTSTTITQRLITVDGRRKRETLRTLINNSKVQNAIVFCNRKKDVKDVYMSLERHGFSVGQLHGDMPQSERMKVLAAFKANEIQLLCASDVAARGLDISAVSHVFNFDVPMNAEDYVHRIGRTGRAGRAGIAITLAAKSKTDVRFVADIEKLIGQKIELIADCNNPDGATIGGSTDQAPADKVQTEVKAEEKPEVKAEVKAEKPNRRRRSSKKSEDNKSVSETSESTEKPESTDKSDTTEQASDTSTDKVEEKQADDQETGDNKRPNNRNNRNNNNRGRTSSRSSNRDNYRSQDKDRVIRMAPDDWPKNPVVGMGPHVPAFLAREVKLPSRAS